MAIQIFLHYSNVYVCKIIWPVLSDEAGIDIEVGDGKSSSGSDVTERDGGRPSSGECRVLSLSDAAALLARSTSSQSPAPHSDLQRYLTDLGLPVCSDHRFQISFHHVVLPPNGPRAASRHAHDRAV